MTVDRTCADSLRKSNLEGLVLLAEGLGLQARALGEVGVEFSAALDERGLPRRRGQQDVLRELSNRTIVLGRRHVLLFQHPHGVVAVRSHLDGEAVGKVQAFPGGVHD